MLRETFSTLLIGVTSVPTTLRVFVCRNISRTASHSNFSRSVSLFTRTASSRTSILSRRSCRKTLQPRQLHNSFIFASQVSSGATSGGSGLGARLRRLFREYGWSAFGVYITLSALDFPFCYLLVKYLGADKIGELEHTIVSGLKNLIPEKLQKSYIEWRSSISGMEAELPSELSVNDGSDINANKKTASNGLEEAVGDSEKYASLATQLALAYAIHKSFIFVRVPVTAAVTPKIVKILRAWGWDIGKRTTKEAKALKRAALRVKAPSLAMKKKKKKLSRIEKLAPLGKPHRDQS